MKKRMKNGGTVFHSFNFFSFFLSCLPRIDAYVICGSIHAFVNW